jgi:hypothetical protein
MPTITIDFDEDELVEPLSVIVGRAGMAIAMFPDFDPPGEEEDFEDEKAHLNVVANDKS